MIALGVLTTGVLGAAGVLAAGMQNLSSSPADVIVTQKAAQAIEAVFSARDSHKLTWAQIRNVNGRGSDGGIFLDGPQPLKLAGADGLVNTADDTATVETVDAAGQRPDARHRRRQVDHADRLHARDHDSRRPERERPAAIDHGHHHLSERADQADLHADHVHLGVLIEGHDCADIIARRRLHASPS